MSSVRNTYDENGNVIESVDGDGNYTVSTYDANGNVLTTATYDANGTQVSSVANTYDEDGNVVKTVDGDGNYTLSTYNANGNVLTQQIFDANGTQVSSTTNTYDDNGNVVKKVDGDGNYTLSSYDADGSVLTQRTFDANGTQVSSTTDTYDDNGHVVKSVDGDGNYTLATYDANGNMLTQQIFDATGTQVSSTTNTYDENGNLVKSVDGDGNYTVSTYDANGNVLTQQTFGPNGTLVNASTSRYDQDGNLMRSTNGVGVVTNRTYDALGHMLSQQVVGQDGGTSTDMYDEAGNVVKSVDADGNYTLFTHDASGNVLTQQTFSSGGTLVSAVTNTYDKAGTLIKTVDGDGNYTEYTYDAAANQLTAQSYDAAGTLISSTSSTYDQAGNLIKTVDGDGNSTVYTYDAGGNALTQQAFDGSGTVVASTSNTYDQDGNLIQSVNGVGDVIKTTYDANGSMLTQTLGYGTSAAATTQYVYDEAGNLVKVVDPTGNATVWTYNANGSQLSMTDSAGNTATRQYNGGGQLVSYTDRDGRKQTYEYDANGNLTQEQWFDSSGNLVDTLAFTYDPDGNLLTASNANGAYTFTYTSDGSIASMQGPFGVSLAYNYDENGNLTSVQDSAGGTTNYRYDDNRVVTIAYSDSTTTAGVYLSYDADGNLTQIVRYGSNVGPTDGLADTAIGYDGGNMTSIVHTNASGTIANFAYSFDLASQLTSETDNGTTTNYAYDPTGQLTQAGSQRYSFDVNGNPSGAGTHIGPGNELLSNGTFDFTYDGEGNEISKTNIATGDKWVYAYNNANELVSAEETASNGTVEKQVAYSYDAFGNLIEEDVTVPNQPTSVTRFALTWTGSGGPSPGASTADVSWRVWGNLDGNGSLTTRFLNGPAADQLFADMADGNINWLLADHLGSTRDVVDNSGNVLDAINYDAFGTITSQSAPANQPLVGYAGYWFDVGTGLDRTAGRVYDSAAGRWISQDPLSFGAGDTNLYRYVKNSPADANDPSGYQSPSRASVLAQTYGRARPATAASSTQMSEQEQIQVRLRQLRGSNANSNRGWTPSSREMETYLQYYDPTWGLTTRARRDASDARGNPISINVKSQQREQWESENLAVVQRVDRYFQARYDEAKADWDRDSRNHAGSYAQFFGERPNLARQHSLLDYVPVLGSMRDLIYNIRNGTYGQALIAAVNLGDELLLVHSLGRGIFRVARAALAGLSDTAAVRSGRAVLRRQTAEAVLAGRRSARVSIEVLQQTSCFPEGTPLLTPEGDKPVEKFQVGDRILSRPESNCEAPVEVKVVEETFVRVAPVLRLQVGGRTIRTTAEHPFFVRGKGWLCAKELNAGDKLSSHDGQWVTVEAVTDLEEVATVYNLRVSDYHTYFVGSREWGFSVWAHNANYDWFVHEGAVYLRNAEGQIIRTAYTEANVAANMQGQVLTRIQSPQGFVPHLFNNQFPLEVVGAHTRTVTSSSLLRVRGAQWFDFVVLEDGSLVIAQRVAGQGHANLALGQQVRSAGQVQVSGGRIIQIDNASGHYLPTGQNARQSALSAFRNEGFQVADSVYVEKVWNPQTNLWEPINGN